MAVSLGFLILKIQTEFPDCEALRVAGKDRNRPVKIEFELESRNFLRHLHDPSGCDIIICWEHNWPECPLEVIELKKAVSNQRSAFSQSKSKTLPGMDSDEEKIGWSRVIWWSGDGKEQNLTTDQHWWHWSEKGIGDVTADLRGWARTRKVARSAKIAKDRPKLKATPLPQITLIRRIQDWSDGFRSRSHNRERSSAYSQIKRRKKIGAYGFPL